MIVAALPFVPGLGGSKREEFSGSASVVDAAAIAWFVFNLLMTVIAVVMCFRRNPEFAIGPFLAAFCYSPCYIIYALAVPIQ
jgi:hypothetical protein